MDTISRENNSMLPVGGIIVGVIGLLLGGYAAISLSKVNKALADHQAKIEKIDGIEQAANAAAAAGEQNKKDIRSLTGSTQETVTQIGNMLSDHATRLTKIEEAAKKPAAAAAKKGGGEVVAGPGEYVVKKGDTGMKIAGSLGVKLADLQKVNPDVNWNKLSAGQKVKVPAKR